MPLKIDLPPQLQPDPPKKRTGGLKVVEPGGKRKSVLLGVPTYRMMHAQTARFICDIIMHTCKLRPDIVLHLHFTDEMAVAECKHCYDEGKQDNGARNRFAEAALKKGCTHLLMIDSDMDRGTDLGNDLLARLIDQEKDVIAPLFIRRSHPYDVMAKRYVKEQRGFVTIQPEEALSGETIEVGGVGFGVVMIDTRVLREVEKPWFVFEVHNESRMAEDLNFCRKAKRRGFRVWCDTSIKVDHIGTHRYRPEEGISVANIVKEHKERTRVA